jgi:hypothetical protein
VLVESRVKACFDAGCLNGESRLEGFTAQSLNLKFEDLDTTTSQNKHDNRDTSSVFHNLGDFQNFLKTLENRQNFGGVGGAIKWCGRLRDEPFLK